MKKILGVFRSTKTERIGAGTTAKETTRHILWFALEDSSGQYLVQPLMENNLPSGINQSVSREKFHTSYSVDALCYRKHIYPVLQSLRRKVGLAGGFISTDALGETEKAVFKALVAAGGNGEGNDTPAAKYKVVKHLLTNLEDAGEALENYRHEIVRDSITMRKAGKLDLALEVYKRALELDPTDDHLLFNMARVFQAKGDDGKAVRCLTRALQLNPELLPARRLYHYITNEEYGLREPQAPKTAKMPAPPAQVIQNRDDDRRREKRLPISGISVAARFGGFMVSMLLQNVSCNGLLLEISSQTAKPIDAGTLFTLEGIPGKYAKVFSAREAEVVWLANGRIGGRFTEPVCDNTRILAQSLSLV